jgi:hypothetical protein
MAEVLRTAPDVLRNAVRAFAQRILDEFSNAFFIGLAADRHRRTVAANGRPFRDVGASRARLGLLGCRGQTSAHQKCAEVLPMSSV